MPLGPAREKVITGLGKARHAPHRYAVWRWVLGVLFTVGVALLPALDILRFDLWGGRHHWLGEQVGFVEAAKAFAFPFLAINVGIVVASRFIGRYLCGFVCPYGAMARFAEWMRWSEHRGTARILGHGVLLLSSAVLAAITFSFWVDWRVFVEGSPTAVALSSGFLLVITAGLYLATDRVGLTFCQRWCPSGVYFAVLGPETLNGIEFAHPENCTDCHACEMVCPMDLHPREIATQTVEEARGLYPGEMTAHSLCVRCGDCVLACDGTTSRFNLETPLRMGLLSAESRAETRAAREAEDDGAFGSSSS